MNAGIPFLTGLLFGAAAPATVWRCSLLNHTS